MPPAKPKHPVQKLVLGAAEQIVRQGAAIRHAQSALADGRIGEAMVVLDLAVQGEHIKLENLAELVFAKEQELLERADMSDQLNLAAAYIRHQEQFENA